MEAVITKPTSIERPIVLLIIKRIATRWYAGLRQRYRKHLAAHFEVGLSADGVTLS